MLSYNLRNKIGISQKSITFFLLKTNNFKIHSQQKLSTKRKLIATVINDTK